MLLKKSTFALCANGSLASSFSATTSCVRAYHDSRDQNPSTFPRLKARRRWEQQADHLSWPSRAKPTPYDIFGQARGAPYNKARYIELVKLYHPDRHHLTSAGLSRSTKLERYRLVSAANEILSDPVRRRMYDLTGAGWGDADATTTTGRPVHKSWRYEPGNASQNATWEDWERWYRQRQRGDANEKQAPVFMSNAGFAMLVSLFVVVAAWGQATRAGTSGISLVGMQDAKHEHVQQELWRRQSEQAALSRQGRVDSFVTKRFVLLDGHWQSLQGVSSQPREEGSKRA